jgi:hypothetical protein
MPPTLPSPPARSLLVLVKVVLTMFVPKRRATSAIVTTIVRVMSVMESFVSHRGNGKRRATQFKMVNSLCVCAHGTGIKDWVTILRVCGEFWFTENSRPGPEAISTRGRDRGATRVKGPARAIVYQPQDLTLTGAAGRRGPDSFFAALANG